VSYEDIGFEPHQLRRERRETRCMSVRPAVFDQQRPTLFVPQITETLAECLEEDGVVGGGRGAKEANSVRFRGLLPPGGERREKDADSEHDREPDLPHSTSLEDGWRGV
jgi:hypothetical protein